MVARADLLEAWGAGAHGSTYGGNPVACAAALATIDLLEGGLIANAADARRPGAGRAPAAASTGSPGSSRDVRGKGLMIGVEFDTADHAEAVQWVCFERGLLVLECGKTSVRMSPALTGQRGRDGDRPAHLRRGGGRGRRAHGSEVLAEASRRRRGHRGRSRRLSPARPASGIIVR